MAEHHGFSRFRHATGLLAEQFDGAERICNEPNARTEQYTHHNASGNVAWDFYYEPSAVQFPDDHSEDHSYNG